MILVVEWKAGDEDGVRLADGVLNRLPQLVVPHRAPVLIVEREPDRRCPEKRAGASILLTPRLGCFPRELEAEATIPRARRLAGIRVACENGDDRDGGS
jgi:hypothetical protein